MKTVDGLDCLGIHPKTNITLKTLMFHLYALLDWSSVSWNLRRVNMTRRPQPLHSSPMSAPRRVTIHS